MAGQRSEGPVAEFCAALRQLQEGCGLDRADLARRLNYSRSQLYQILDGGIRRPPEWDRLVEPLVRACTGSDERAVATWRRRHGVLVAVYGELRRTQRNDTPKISPGPMRVVPAQLPADVDVFTGRAAELAELDCLLAADRSDGTASTAVVISAVSGTAGVGKTALALRWAHRVRGDFPDGQLYVNLRGYDTDKPLSAGDALAGFLRALGLAGQDIPLEVDERAAAYRSMLDGRRMLVVLDNAATVEQIRPLLPGAASCLVLVTSRDSLAGLVARHGARRLDLDLLPPEDAVALLRALIGVRVEAEPDAAVTLASQCARLPLALRVAAELAAARPASSLTALVTDLADEQQRLRLLDAGGDSRTAVRCVFSWSYQHLPVDAARAFRLLGLHPGLDFDPYAAAALTDASYDQAHHVLDLLSRAHLIQLTNTCRYGMHDLLRAYATHLAISDDLDDERRAALTRLFDFYLGTAAAAMDTLFPAEQHRRPRVSPPATPCPAVADPIAARAWLDAERDTLTAASAHTATHGWLRHATRLATTLFRYLERAGHYPGSPAIHTYALRAAHRAGDSAAAAHALGNLGGVYWWQGHYHQAANYYEQALALSREIGDPAGEARAVGNLGLVCWRQGHYQQAADYHQRALALFREVGDRLGETVSLFMVGTVHWQQGRYDHAVDHLQEALALSRDIGDLAGEARAVGYLGLVCWRRGHYQQAVDYLQRALALSREIGYGVGEALALDSLGCVYQWHGHYRQAADYYQRALILSREISYQIGEVQALNGLGETHQTAGEFDEASTQHAAALALATEIGDRYEKARAHNGLGQTYHAVGELDRARQHWCKALILFTDLGVPEAKEVRAQLLVLDFGTANGSLG